jgi:hypothetical protein
MIVHLMDYALMENVLVIRTGLDMIVLKEDVQMIVVVTEYVILILILVFVRMDSVDLIVV